MHARYENFDKWHYTKYVRQDPDGESLIYSKDYESRAPTVLDEWSKQVVEPLADSHKDGIIAAKPVTSPWRTSRYSPGSKPITRTTP